MAKWFAGITHLDDLKAKYKKLALEYHPDVSKRDTTREMQEINAEYKLLFKSMLSGSGATETEVKEAWGIELEYIDVLNKLAAIDGIKIELVGSWIWVSGNTYANKTKLKEIGCQWAPKKMLWYYRSEEHRTASHGKLSYEEIKAKYGSKDVTGKYKKPATLNDEARKKRAKAKTTKRRK